MTDNINIAGYEEVAGLKMESIRHMWYDSETDVIVVKYEYAGKMAQKNFGPNAKDIQALVTKYQAYVAQNNRVVANRFGEIWQRINP